ncbi:hypothetical protein AB0F44_30120, partial [Nocardioides sp. NPDC023903]
MSSKPAKAFGQVLGLAIAVSVVMTPGTATAEPVAATTWLCHPSATGDPCDLPSDTTDLGTGQVDTPIRMEEADKPVDCFYLYPTVSD